MRKVIIFSCLIVVFGLTGHLCGDTLTGLPDLNAVGSGTSDISLISLTYDGTEYIAADGDLATGTTTRWWTDNGVPTLWEEGTAAPPDNGTNTSNPKVGDVGSHADNFDFRIAGINNMSSIDGIDYQETLFDFYTDTIFVFERGGNDNGKVQAILADGNLGEELTLIKNGAPYANTGVNVGGSNAFGYVLVTDVPVKGLRITAPGHDALSISAPAPKDILAIYPVPLPDPGGKNVPAEVTFEWTLSGDLDVLPGSYTIYMDTNAALVSEPNLPSQPMLLDGTGDQTGILPAGPDDPTGQYSYSGIELDKTYYWKIVADVFEPNATNPEIYDVPKTLYGSVWSFSAETSAPVIEIGGSLLTWLQEGQAVFAPDATVTDATNDLDYIEWSILGSPTGSTVDISDTAAEKPTITVNTAGPYLFNLKAVDLDENVTEKMVEMDVYPNSCLAAQSQNNPEGYTAPQYDFNGDCIEDIADLAMLLTEWMQDKSMTEEYRY